ncbi:MAG TPA: multidrug efflux SMR transporter [Rhodocyclaceae bacterium]|nr:multidrug efflux SMR transporter [Rhodocyclaceae bacterium]
MSHWFYLGLAIVFEVIATTALKATTGFSRLWPSLLVVTGYAGAFYFLSLSLRSVPIGVAYAVWSGAGVALIALLAWLVHGQALNLAACAGIALIVAGVIVLNVFGQSGPSLH